MNFDKLVKSQLLECATSDAHFRIASYCLFTAISLSVVREQYCRVAAWLEVLVNLFLHNLAADQSDLCIKIVFCR